MPKKRTERQRQEAERQARGHQRRLVAREAADREAHAQLVVQRSGDPRYAQRIRQPDGQTVLTWGEADAPRMREALAAQLAAFQEKFGREPGPTDPLFFDPDADEPMPMGQRQWDEGLARVAEAAEAAGVDAAYIHAWREVGYMVTDVNQHLFSAAEVKTYLDAVARYQDGDLGEDVELSAQWGDAAARTPDMLRALVAETIATGGAEAAWGLADVLDEADNAEVAGLAATTAVSVMLAWLAAARERVPATAAAAAVTWVGDHLGSDEADQALVLASVLGHPSAPPLTVEQAFDRLGDATLPALVWLTAGLVAAAAGGNPAWLTQFDPDLD
ncbi:hypothetical protein [Phytohabitans rumicis]|uniref:Uncharacterized protein n=1 Tax=Phytohabitans rumicis TaxID=1076125 RepID=A0A6V8LL58_9ACTN|nr:hypothetical protein [Phytohabitans rumicis]GFJ93365.1 hypothetical protein Prum_070070 [Phytohabitans rumicis]